MIYDSCLNIGRVFPFYWESGAPEASFPNTALLPVCKTIHLEAEPVLYHNAFKLCLSTKQRKLFLRSLEIGLIDNGSVERSAVQYTKPKR